MKAGLLLKVVLIFVVLVAFIFVFDVLMCQRVSIYEGAKNMGYTDDSAAISDAKAAQISNQPAPVGYPPGTSPCSITKLRLLDYCIKGSANSAFSGSYTSNEMIQYVLSRGVRFLDLQVFWIDGQNGQDAYVGYTSNKLSYAPDGIKNTNIPPLSYILSTIVKNAFVQLQGSNYVVTNPTDPLFIQIRLQTDTSTMTALYDRIQKILSVALRDNSISYGNTQVSQFTPLSQIHKKLLIGFDSDDYYTVRPDGNNPNDYVNFLTNSETMRMLTYNEVNPTYNINISPPKSIGQYTTDVANFYYVQPDNDTSPQPNPNALQVVKMYGTQVILNQYYAADTNLINSEVMFSACNGGIVPLRLCLAYINNTAEPSETEIPTK